MLTDNGTHFTSPGNTCSAAADVRRAIEDGEQFLAHAFEYACAQNHIDHRLTKPRHPWTNGQVERMNRTLKEATVKRFHYDAHDQLRRHLGDFGNDYNFGRRLKTSRALPLRNYLQSLDSRTETFQAQPAPPNAGIKHLGRDRRVSEPDRQAAALPQGRVVGRRVRDPVTLLGNVVATLGIGFERHGPTPGD